MFHEKSCFTYGNSKLEINFRRTIEFDLVIAVANFGTISATNVAPTNLSPTNLSPTSLSPTNVAPTKTFQSVNNKTSSQPSTPASSPLAIYHEPIMLQYSDDGGIHWRLIAKYSTFKNRRSRITYHNGARCYQHHVAKIPKEARTQGNQVRWWQPIRSGHPSPHWSLEQVGGVIYLIN